MQSIISLTGFFFMEKQIEHNFEVLWFYIAHNIRHLGFVFNSSFIIFIIIINIMERGRQCKAESDMHPISPKTSAQQYQPIDRKKRKEK